jgi:hypothetical protein
MFSQACLMVACLQVIMKKNPWLMKIRLLLLKGLDFLELPPNPIDYLTELCGGHTQVAEMTGRKQQQVGLGF